MLGPTVDKINRTGPFLKDDNPLKKADKQDSFIVSYYSLPEKFRKQLKIGEIEKLDDFGGVKLLVRISNLTKAGPSVVVKQDNMVDCGPVQPPNNPGGKCLNTGSIHGDLEIVAVTGAYVTVDEILEAGKIKSTLKENFTPDIAKSWVSDLSGDRIFRLFSYHFDIGQLNPVHLEGKDYVVDGTNWDQVYCYIFYDLERDNIQVKPLADLQILSASVRQADDQRGNVLLDIYRALQTGLGLGLPDIIAGHVAISTEEASSIQSGAQLAETRFKRWMLLNLMSDSEPNWIDVANQCTIKADNVLFAWRNREWLFLQDDKLLILDDPVDRKCWPNSFTASAVLGVEAQIQLWLEWLEAMRKG